MNRKGGKREQGITLVMVALCLLVFMAIAALAVDLGVMYTARTSAQHAADAGALAGAFAHVTQPASADIRQAAVAVANQNNILGTPANITISDVSISSGCNYAPGTGNDCLVIVNVPRTANRGNPVTLYFARTLGWVSADIVASATAEALPFPTGGRCIRPIYIPNTVLSTATDVTKACKQGQIMLNSGNGQPSNWLLSLPPCPQSGPCYPGSPILLKPVNCANCSSDTLPPSQYYALDFGSGTSSYQCLWSSCMTAPACKANKSAVQCGSQQLVLTGNMKDPTIKGVDNLICGPSGDCSINPQDTWVSVGNYRSPSGMDSPTSRSLTVAPVWDDCSTTLKSGTNGQQVAVIGFAEIFVDNVDSQGNVTGQLVRPLGCNNGNSSGTGSLAIPVRLVQPTS